MPSPMKEHPYLSVIDQPRMMRGKGAPRSTVFGVLGRTVESPYSKSLGGLVADSKADAPVPRANLHKNSRMTTERHITGRASRTHISGHHFGQVPYAGRYMGPKGEEL